LAALPKKTGPVTNVAPADGFADVFFPATVVDANDPLPPASNSSRVRQSFFSMPVISRISHITFKPEKTHIFLTLHVQLESSRT
jgi:hypothetical protein